MQSYPATRELILFAVVLTFSVAAIHAMNGYVRSISFCLQKVVTAVFDKISFPRNLVVKSSMIFPPVRKSTVRYLAYRFKFTLFMFFLNIYTFIFTNDFVTGEVSSSLLESRGFSYANFAHHKWFVLLTSNFVHFHSLHLAVNMAMLVILCGSLELLVGGRIAAFVYLGAMNSNVPNGLFLLPALRILYPHVWAETVQYVDVGASLGIMGCLGGLAAVLVPKAKWAVIGLSIVGSVVGAAYIHNLFGIDHAFSILLGFLICSHYRRMESRKLVLIPLEPSPEIRRTGTG